MALDCWNPYQHIARTARLVAEIECLLRTCSLLVVHPSEIEDDLAPVIPHATCEGYSMHVPRVSWTESTSNRSILHIQGIPKFVPLSKEFISFQFIQLTHLECCSNFNTSQNQVVCSSRHQIPARSLLFFFHVE